MGLRDRTLRSDDNTSSRRSPFGGFWRLRPAVAVLLFVNIAIELALTTADRGLWAGPWLREVAIYLGAFYPSMLDSMQPSYPLQPIAMFGTYAFLHGGPVHLGLNMLALYLFGTAIIERVGPRLFLWTYAVSAIGGAAFFYMLGDGSTPMVGASGALFGLLGVWSCWDFLEKRFYRASIWETVRPLFYLLIYNLAFSVLLSGQLAWEAHLGGFVTGWIVALYWGRPTYRKARLRREAGRSPRPRS